MGKPKTVEDKSASNKKYCKRYPEKKKEKLRKTEKDRKKLEREYEKYFCFEKRLEQNRIRTENIGKEKKRKTKVNFPYLFRKHHNHHLDLHLGMGIKIHQKKYTNTKIHKGNESVSRSKQSLYRSIKRAEKYLPNSLRKKKEVLNNLASKYNLRIKLKNKRGPKKAILE